MAISANILSNEGQIPAEMVRDMFNAVEGHSALAKLSPERPLPFNGATMFVFDMDTEVDIVAENAPKTEGGGSATAKTIQPIKFEYGMRASDEFMKGTEAYRIDVTERFIEGFARKLARGLDIGAIHGVNPRTNVASGVIGYNCLSYQIATVAQNVVAYDASTPDANLEAAIAMIDGKVNGLAMGPDFATAMAGVNVNGVPQYPDFRFGNAPESFYGMTTDVNSTVPYLSGGIQAIVGDFDAFRWGYAEDVTFEVIEYGDPDNTGADLKGHNQVYLRGEAYIGWAILDAEKFAAVNKTASGGK